MGIKARKKETQWKVQMQSLELPVPFET